MLACTGGQLTLRPGTSKASPGAQRPPPLLFNDDRINTTICTFNAAQHRDRAPIPSIMSGPYGRAMLQAQSENTRFDTH